MYLQIDKSRNPSPPPQTKCTAMFKPCAKIQKYRRIHPQNAFLLPKAKRCFYTFPMFNHRFDQNADDIVVAHWFLMSFNGGFINAGGFLATGRFVSHVTGFATLFGVRLADHDVGAAFGILSVPVFFLLGAFLAGLLIDRPLYRGRKPHFDWVMGLSAVCLMFAAGCERIFHLSLSGRMIDLEESYVLLILLCMASGLQNAAITSSSGRSVRTTHLTGLTTDLGLGLARIFTFRDETERGRAERRANFLRLGSILAFVFGSAAGALIFVHWGYRGFLGPAVIALYAAWHGKKAKVTAHTLSPP